MSGTYLGNAGMGWLILNLEIEKVKTCSQDDECIEELAFVI